MVATPTSSSFPTVFPFRRVHHWLASPTATTSVFLGRIAPLVSLFVLVAWGQFDVAQCKGGYDWVCGDLCFLERECQGDLSQRPTFARPFCFRFP